MFKNSLLKIIPFLLFVLLLNSCDKEFSVIGEDLVGNNSFNLDKGEYSVISYNQKLGAIQSNNISINAFGIYDNPAFGTNTATFVTQVTLDAVNPTIDVSATITKAVLTIPYFVDKNKTVTSSDGSSTYVLDSIYGPDKAKMKLSIYESGYFMSDLDPADQFANPQKYYSDQYSDFYQKIKPLSAAPYYLNDDADVAQNTAFFFDPTEYSEPSSDGKTTTRTPPAMRLNLNKDFFQNKILKAPAASLKDNVAFKDYFRGLFFNIERIGSDPGNLAMLNFKGGKITITYNEKISEVVTEHTLTLSLSGNTVSLLNETNVNGDYTNNTKPGNINNVQGDPNLYLKGGAGSLSILELFGPDLHGADGTGAPNGFPDEIDAIKKNKYLINEANLIFHINTSAMGTAYLPQRIYLYDYTNNTYLADYLDATSVSSNAKYNKYIFGGLLTKDADGKGGYYKFRITNHVRSLVKADTYKAIKLGLVVTEDINSFGFFALKDKNGVPLFAPVASVMNPLGVVVFGNNIPVGDPNYNNRLKFEIYYTKPN